MRFADDGCNRCGEVTDEHGRCLDDVCERTVPVLRWACRCGRFIAQGSIEETNHRDDSTYYGVRTDTRYSCSRCGTVDAEPVLIEVGTVLLDPAESVTPSNDAFQAESVTPEMTHDPVDNSPSF